MATVEPSFANDHEETNADERITNDEGTTAATTYNCLESSLSMTCQEQEPASSSNDDNINTILHDTALAACLSYLTWQELLRVSTVCRHWRAVVAHEPLATAALEIFCQTQTTADHLPRLAQTLPRAAALRIDLGNMASEAFGLESKKQLSFLKGPAAPLPSSLSSGSSWSLQHHLQSLTLRDAGLTEWPFARPSDSNRNATYCSFPNLTKLDLSFNPKLEWDLSFLTLSGNSENHSDNKKVTTTTILLMPRLQQLWVSQNRRLTGTLTDLNPLRATLTHLRLWQCRHVTGELRQLSDYPHLQHINLDGTQVVGSARELLPEPKQQHGQANTKQQPYFAAIQTLILDAAQDDLCSTRDLATIRQAADVMQARLELQQRFPHLVYSAKQWYLAQSSPDRYSAPPMTTRQQQPSASSSGRSHRPCRPRPPQPPMAVEFVRAGTRVGWRWTNCTPTGACQIHWLTPAPAKYVVDYCSAATTATENVDTAIIRQEWLEYRRQLAELQRNIADFCDYWQPPSRLEYWQQFVL